MKSWTCIEKCGACCKFDLHKREDIFNILNEEDIKLIEDMTGKDGWCKNLDKKNKKCLIYEERPHFCRVDTFSKNFKGYISKGDDFLISCCKEHISSIYGKRSKMMIQYKDAITKKF
tara:strand:+ start:17203 stop:17553 length:351 start_codon:yes stop_codon:yes gene_type:complete